MTSLFFGSYVRQIETAAIGCNPITQRVPDIGAENVAVHIGDDGRVDEIRFLGSGFSASPPTPLPITGTRSSFRTSPPSAIRRSDS